MTAKEIANWLASRTWTPDVLDQLENKIQQAIDEAVKADREVCYKDAKQLVPCRPGFGGCQETRRGFLTFLEKRSSPFWCEHVVQDDDGNWKVEGSNLWLNGLIVQRQFSFCPVCGAVKPERISQK